MSGSLKTVVREVQIASKGCRGQTGQERERVNDLGLLLSVWKQDGNGVEVGTGLFKLRNLISSKDSL